MNIFKSLEFSLKYLANGLMDFRPQATLDDTQEWEEAESDASYIKHFAKLGSFMEKKLAKLLSGFSKWRNSARWVISPEDYWEIARSESHYRKKLLGLIQTIEEKRDENKLIKGKEFERLERVNNFISEYQSLLPISLLFLFHSISYFQLFFLFILFQVVTAILTFYIPFSHYALPLTETRTSKNGPNKPKSSKPNINLE